MTPTKGCVFAMKRPRKFQCSNTNTTTPQSPQANETYPMKLSPGSLVRRVAAVVPSVVIIFLMSVSPRDVRAQAAPATDATTLPSPATVVPTQADVTTNGQQNVETLSPFVVDATQDQGYLANNTLAGSRLNTALADTPASIQVFTTQFLQDIGANSLSDVMVYGNNTAFDLDEGTAGGANGNELTNFQQYRVRGEDVTFARNYFDINGGDIPVDVYNLGRIEESRGPNAILFGIGSPAGVVDVDTKEALVNQNFTDVTSKIGSYGSWRFMLDANRSFDDGKFAIRFNATDFDLENYRYYTFNIGKMEALAMKYELTKKIELRIEAENVQTHDAAPKNEPEFDSIVPWLQLGKPSFSPNNGTVNFTDAESNNTYPPLPGQQQVAQWYQNPTNTLNGQTLVYNQTPGKSGQGQLINDEGQVVTNAYYYPTVLSVEDPGLASPRINTMGPGGGRFAHYQTWSGFVDMQLLPRMYLEAGYNHMFDNFLAWNNSGGNTLYVDPNLTLPNGTPNPYYGQYYNQTNWQNYTGQETYDRGRVSLSYEFDLGKWFGHYRLAVNAERDDHGRLGASNSEAYEGSPFAPGTPDNYLNFVQRRSYVVTGDWKTYYNEGPTGVNGFLNNATDPISGQSYSSYMVPTSLSSYRSKQESILAAGQAYFWNDKIVIGGGVRRDILEANNRGDIRDPNTGLLEVSDDPALAGYQSIGGDTISLGAVVHVIKGLDLIADKSTNFTLPNPNTITLNGSGVGGPGSVEYQPAPQGTGNEWGFAINLADNKLYFKAVHFANSATNNFDYPGYYTPYATNNVIMQAYLGAGLINQTTENAHDTSSYAVYLYNETDSGEEFSLVANPTKHWRIEANFSINNPDETAVMANDISFWANVKKYYATMPQGNNIVTFLGDTVGQEISETDANIALLTSVEGVGVIGFRKYKGSMFTRYDFSDSFVKGIFVGGGYVWQSKMLIAQPIPSILEYSGEYSNANALIGYQFKIAHHPASIQLNASNLFNETSPIIYRRNTQSGQGNTFATAAEFPNPRAYQITAEYKF
jgi:iron complex outermembrane recepter protein